MSSSSMRAILAVAGLVAASAAGAATIDPASLQAAGCFGLSNCSVEGVTVSTVGGPLAQKSSNGATGFGVNGGATGPEIDIGEVIVQGTVIGNIKAKRSIEIHAPGRVKGDLHTPTLQVDKGVIFEGRSFMEAANGGLKPPAPPKPAAAPTPVK